jgi:hypothetical protein
MNPAFDPRPPLRVLLAHDVRFVIIGGIAGVLLGSPSLTFDLDINDLLRMKRAAGRPKDLLAVEILSALKEEKEKFEPEQ